uniref:Proteasome assembly chaperone 3 n=1 Tax=Anopheles melas TaxID=34690 RepID=A0A182UAS7_9DIPT
MAYNNRLLFGIGGSKREWKNEHVQTKIWFDIYQRVEVCEVQYNIRVLKMKDSVLFYIGQDKAETFDEMAVAMPNANNGTEVLGTTIIGPPDGSGAQDLAQRLAKRLKKQVYLSLGSSVPNDRIVRPSIEKKIFDDIKNNIECF